MKTPGKGRAPGKDLKALEQADELEKVNIAYDGNRSGSAVNIYSELLRLVAVRKEIEATEGKKAWKFNRRMAAECKKSWKGVQKLQPLPPSWKRTDSWRWTWHSEVARWIMAFNEPAVLTLLMRILSAVERGDSQMFKDIARIMEATPETAIAWPEAYHLMMDKIINGDRQLCLREANEILKPHGLRMSQTRFLALRNALAIPGYHQGEKPNSHSPSGHHPARGVSKQPTSSEK